MKKYLIPLLFFSIILSLTNTSFAHSGNVMIGFVDGLRHPVIGLDHLVAMISVGAISAQIGGLAIWFVPGLFVFGMLIGTSLAVLIYYLRNITNPNQFVLYVLDNFADYIYFIVEFGIAFSVLFLGSIICFNKKLPLIYISVIIFSFGITHGAAHGISIPYVIRPYMFISGFCLGTVLLHLLGVAIGYSSIAYTYIDKTLRLSGILIFFFGVYLIINLL